MRRRTIVFILFTIAMLSVALLGYLHIITPTVSRTALFAAGAGYLYYRLGGRNKNKKETIYGITEGDEELKGPERDKS